MATTVTFGNVINAVKNNIATIKTAIGNATTSAAGLMSNTDKSKLDGIATGANKTTVDSALSTSSTNPVQNKVVATQINSLNGNLPSTYSGRSDILTTCAFTLTTTICITTDVVRAMTNGHYIVAAHVWALITGAVPSSSSEYRWLSLPNLLSPTMNALGCTTCRMCPAVVYPVYGDDITDAVGYGVGVQYDANNNSINLGRWYDTNGSFGQNSMKHFVQGKGAKFSFYAEIY